MRRRGSGLPLGLGFGVRVLLMVVVGIVFVLPLIWMVSTSIKPEDQAMSAGLSLLPDPPSATLDQGYENYRAVLTDETVDFPLFFRNTMIVVLLGVSGAMVSSVVVAFGLARVPMRGRRVVLLATIGTMLIPFPVIMVPLFILYSKLGWIGTTLPLYAQFFFGNAFSIFLLHQFFRNLPKELDEAAQLDGCSSFQLFWHITLPMSRTVLAVVGLLHFTYMWNDFLAPLVFLVNRDQWTVALGLQLYQSRAGQTPWSLLMAASVITVLPVLVVFVLANRMFSRGVTAGAVKG
ncbi:MAG: carbohydrate ABC transporter permease [Planctomycetota bacterium]